MIEDTMYEATLAAIQVLQLRYDMALRDDTPSFARRIVLRALLHLERSATAQLIEGAN